VSITILLFLAPIGAIIAWWLSRQRLMAKPWLEVGAIDDFPGTGASSLPAATIGLGVFLAVVSSLFALFISAYLMLRVAPGTTSRASSSCFAGRPFT
jgi:cytochrome c oxidase subunit 3